MLCAGGTVDLIWSVTDFDERHALIRHPSTVPRSCVPSFGRGAITTTATQVQCFVAMVGRARAKRGGRGTVPVGDR
jgi:hypothetical protein